MLIHFRMIETSLLIVHGRTRFCQNASFCNLNHQLNQHPGPTHYLSSGTNSIEIHIELGQKKASSQCKRKSQSLPKPSKNVEIKPLHPILHVLKPFQIKKGLSIFQVHRFWCFFYSWQLRKKAPKTVHLEIFLALLIL